MLKRFHRMFAQPGFRLCAVLLLASGMMLGQERRPPTLKGGAQQQDYYSNLTLNSLEDYCQMAREALDLYHKAAANPELVSSDEWREVIGKLDDAGNIGCPCPFVDARVYIERLRRMQIARPNPRARAELLRPGMALAGELRNGYRTQPTLQNFDYAIQKNKEKIQESIKKAEKCYEACMEGVQLLRDPNRLKSSGPCRQSPLQHPAYLRLIGQTGSSNSLPRSPQPYGHNVSEEQKAIIATVEGNPMSYRSIYERSRYYDTVSSILASDPRTKNISFFRAASGVTNERNLGAIEEPGIGTAIHNAASK